MTQRPSDRSQNVPTAPEPSSASPRDGMTIGREDARCYLPNLVRLLAGIALAPDADVALHTRMMCAKELVAIAGVIPPVPAAPQPHDEGGDGGSDDGGDGPS